MKELDPLYLSLLHWGLISVRNASYAGDINWCRAEAEHLHEIPTLIGDENIFRHFDYARRMRRIFLSWLEQANNPELKKFVDDLYCPIWKKMADILTTAVKSQ